MGTKQDIYTAGTARTGFRVVSWLCIAFLVLASSRGVIPAVCANLSTVVAASEVESASCEVRMGESGCCTGMPSSDAAGQQSGEKDCPLCSLIHGV